MTQTDRRGLSGKEPAMVNRDELTSEGTVVNGVHLSNDERQPCEVWTRVMGYHRPVSSFNTGKKGEFHERVEFMEPVGMCRCGK